MKCAACVQEIEEGVEPHETFHDDDCAFSASDRCICTPLPVHPWCCQECKTGEGCLPEVPVTVRRFVRLPEPLASEEAAS